jgi:hypothetical protein
MGSTRHASIAIAMAALLAAPLATTAQSDGDPPPCAPGASFAGACRLAAWPTDGAAALPSRFGPLEPGGVWIDDAPGDAPPGGLDILGVGLSMIPVEGAAALRRADDVLRLGGRSKAIREGDAVLIRTLLASPPEALADGYAGVFVATDIDGVRTNDAPSGIEAPDGPFAGLQQVYSLNVAAGEEPEVLYSDLARGWYKGREAFAAHRPAPEVVDFLVRRERFGDVLRVATFSSGAGGSGYDVVGVGPAHATIPLDGVVGTLPTCIEASVANDPWIVDRLVESGETFRDIETPRSWSVAATFPLGDEERAALDGLIAAGDGDADGLDLRGSVVVIEEGLNVRQAPAMNVRLVDGEAVLSVTLGLTRRGFMVLRDLEVEPTGDAVADAFLARAADALVASVPPFRVARKAGQVLASAGRPCVASASARSG